MSNAKIGYCTNVHSGITLNQIKRNLEKETLAVKRQVSPNDSMGVGLWLSESATRQLENRAETFRFRDWLGERDLVPFTINAFPFGDFHQPVVKHDVYQPTWAHRERLDYTCAVASILANLLPSGAMGTISTLPLGWPNDATKGEGFLQACAAQFARLAEFLESVAEKTGVLIRVCIEPEPGCVLDTCDDVVKFFCRYLLVADERLRSRVECYLGVCHDVCHSAVMFEPQSVALNCYAEAGISVGKVQVSSAIEVDFDSLDASQAIEALQQLATFAEPRYLHQTCVQLGERTEFFEDLPLAIAAADPSYPGGKWRVHFHVPIHEPSFGLIQSTQSSVRTCVEWFKNVKQADIHFEVETYAWNVLPIRLRPQRLADGIADEISWFTSQCNG